MDKHTYGEIFERQTPSSSRETRASRSRGAHRPSYNEDLLAPRIGEEEDDGVPHPSIFPCFNFMRDAGIYDDFIRMINNVGLMEFMQDERPQYANLTKIFVESFKFNNSTFNPTVEFKIYDRACNMDLKRFCRVIGVAPSGTARKIKSQPPELLDLYHELSYDDHRRVQRGKIRNIQFPAIRYFTYYLATSVLARENTSNISCYHLAFLAHALKNDKTYNLGALIARRLAAKGPIFGGIIAARVLADLGLSVDPSDELLIPERLDLAAMKLHDFVTTNSYNGHLMYRVVFANGPELEVRLPQPSLFSVFRGPLSYSREDLDNHLGAPDFHLQHYPEDRQETFMAPPEDYTVYYGGASSSFHSDEEPSSSHTEGAPSWQPWG